MAAETAEFGLRKRFATARSISAAVKLTPRPRAPGVSPPAPGAIQASAITNAMFFADETSAVGCLDQLDYARARARARKHWTIWFEFLRSASLADVRYAA